jgi:MazG C-terminal domain/MazG nucleotide pyrophosphohydrolase domain
VTGDDLTLDDYQRMAAATDVEGDSDDPIVPLLGLAGEVGSLIAEFKKKRRPDGLAYRGFDEVVVTELGDILWYLAALARRVGVPLSGVAHQNLAKTRARWLSSDGPARLSFDDGFPEGQRLPRSFDVSFETSGQQVVMRIAGEEIGDPIDDNARVADGYRFHDVFHLGYLAVLGWSPILRALLRRKRKADPDIDRAEDGARACAVEEAVAAYVFEMARPYDFFAGVIHIDDKILRGVRAVAGGLEVAACSPSDWERAILTGFGAWRGLRAAGRGLVRVDRDARTLRFLG